MLVSVIIPVYNVFSFFPEALESVLCQSYRNLEIILIDDGSTDGSERLCDEYARKDARIRVIHQDHKGLSVARNVGLELATGEFVAFLDSDDSYHSDYIKLMLDAAVEKQTDIVICKYTTIYYAGEKHNRWLRERQQYPKIEKGAYDRKHALKLLIDGAINPNVWNKLYSRKLWDAIQFPVGRVYEDMETICKIINTCQKVYVIDHVLYYHRKRCGSITSSCSLDNIIDGAVAYSNLIAFVEDKTPELFSEKQLLSLNKLALKNMISLFIQYSCKEDGFKNVSFLETFRGTISRFSNTIVLNDCDLRIKIGYFLVNHNPRILKFIYPLYCFIKRCIRSDKG